MQSWISRLPRRKSTRARVAGSHSRFVGTDGGCRASRTLSGLNTMLSRRPTFVLSIGTSKAGQLTRRRSAGIWTRSRFNTVATKQSRAFCSPTACTAGIQRRTFTLTASILHCPNESRHPLQARSGHHREARIAPGCLRSSPHPARTSRRRRDLRRLQCNARALLGAVHAVRAVQPCYVSDRATNHPAIARRRSSA